jgi:hypothetical protein
MVANSIISPRFGGRSFVPAIGIVPFSNGLCIHGEIAWIGKICVRCLIGSLFFACLLLWELFAVFCANFGKF